jgi:glyoxylase-like metal-dependent hydrolase (beta-lactamase superfamily II)
VCLEIGGKGEGGEGARGKGEGGERHLFVGDTLFAGSIGRTDLPGGNYNILMRSITEVLFALGDEAIVHPGHGPDTTIGRERRTNPFVLEYLSRNSKDE